MAGHLWEVANWGCKWGAYQTRIIEEWDAASIQTLLSFQAFGPGLPLPDLTVQVYPPNSISLPGEEKATASSSPANRHFASRFIV